MLVSQKVVKVEGEVYDCVLRTFEVCKLLGFGF